MYPIIRIAGVVGAALLMSGCMAHRPAVVDLTPAGVVAPADTWVASSDGRFGVRIPEGWALSQRGGDGTVLLARGADTADGLIVLRDFPTPVVPGDEALEQVREGAIEGLAADMAGFRLESHRDLYIEGKRALQIEYRCTLAGERMHGNLTILVGEGGLYSANAIAPREVSEHADLAVKRLLASIRIDATEAANIPAAEPSEQAATLLSSVLNGD